MTIQAPQTSRSIQQTFMALFMVSSWLASSACFAQSAPMQEGSWKVTQVTPFGITIEADRNSYVVPVGSRLPNGERLLGVSPEQSAYTTKTRTGLARTAALAPISRTAPVLSDSSDPAPIKLNLRAFWADKEDAKPKNLVSAQEVSTARKTNRLEVVPGPNIGVDHIEADAVIMKSGTRIKVGEYFSSGERLLAVDPTLGQILTNERTVVLL